MVKTSSKRNTIILAVLIILLLGIGTFLYITRPLEAPSIDFTKTPVTSSGSTTESGSTITYSIDATRSKASFSIFEVLRGNDFTVVGTTNQIAGTVTLDMSDPSQSKAGEFKVNARTLKTDSPQRDGAINRMILKSETPGNEFIIFTPTSVTGLPTNGEVGKDYMISITGNLMIAGAVKPTTFTAQVAYLQNGEIQGIATTSVRRADFNLNIPNLPFIANVGETVSINVEFVAVRS
ncbi:MAG: YceI family protein [Candidatus Gracilibacteria bacterium]